MRNQRILQFELLPNRPACQSSFITTLTVVQFVTFILQFSRYFFLFSFSCSFVVKNDATDTRHLTIYCLIPAVHLCTSDGEAARRFAHSYGQRKRLLGSTSLDPELTSVYRTCFFVMVTCPLILFSQQRYSDS